MERKDGKVEERDRKKNRRESGRSRNLIFIYKRFCNRKGQYSISGKAAILFFIKERKNYYIAACVSPYLGKFSDS